MTEREGEREAGEIDVCGGFLPIYELDSCFFFFLGLAFAFNQI
jgi:hypothetical protein